MIEQCEAAAAFFPNKLAFLLICDKLRVTMQLFKRTWQTSCYKRVIYPSFYQRTV